MTYEQFYFWLDGFISARSDKCSAGTILSEIETQMQLVKESKKPTQLTDPQYSNQRSIAPLTLY